MAENLLKKIQEADSATKRRILVISSAVAMVVVLYVWLVFFNNLLAEAGAPAVAPPTGLAGSAEAGQESAQMSFWGTMRRGSALLYENVTGALGSFGEMLNGSREYIVKPLK